MDDYFGYQGVMGHRRNKSENGNSFTRRHNLLSDVGVCFGQESEGFSTVSTTLYDRFIVK